MSKVIDATHLGRPQKQSHLREGGRVVLTEDHVDVQLIEIDGAQLKVLIDICGMNWTEPLAISDCYEITAGRVLRFDRINGERVEFSAWSPDHIKVQTRDRADTT